jgi:hypothetical protein
MSPPREKSNFSSRARHLWTIEYSSRKAGVRPAIMKTPLKGQIFNRLTVISTSVGRLKRNGRIYYLCRCKCGTHLRVDEEELRRGGVKSCGCWNEQSGKARITHGATIAPKGSKQHKLYCCWLGMKSRCFDPSHISFAYYGGRGIQISAQWATRFEFFWRDMQATWAPGLEIDRINNDSHYNRQNCRWATRKEQVRNSRRIFRS